VTGWLVDQLMLMEILVLVKCFAVSPENGAPSGEGDFLAFTSTVTITKRKDHENEFYKFLLLW
jgi:hypothetical protein